MKRIKIASAVLLLIIFFICSLQINSFGIQNNHPIPQTETEDFEIQIEEGEVVVLAGNGKEINLTIMPKPTFTNIIQLKYTGIEPAEMKKYLIGFNFSNNGFQMYNQPVKTSVGFSFAPKTPPTSAKLTFKAEGIQSNGKPIVEHFYVILVQILKNPNVPTLTLTSPSTIPSITNQTPFLLIGETNANELYINSLIYVALDSHGKFTCSKNLIEGRNVLTFNLINDTMRIDETIEIFLDTISPSVNLNPYPSNIFSSSYLLIGKTEPETELLIGINANNDHKKFIKAVVDQNGNFSYPALLKKGLNSIVLIAQDKAGNHTQIEKTIFYATKIELKIGNQTTIINSQSKKMDASPYIKQGRTMVPLYIFSEALELSNKFISASQEIVISNPSKTLKLKIGSLDVWITTYIQEIGQVGDILIHLDSVPEIKNKRTFVPIRFISEQFGFAVSWNSKDSSIVLTNETKETKDLAQNFLCFPVHKVGERVLAHPYAVTVKKVYQGMVDNVGRKFEQDTLMIDVEVECFAKGEKLLQASRPFVLWDENGNKIAKLNSQGLTSLCFYPNHLSTGYLFIKLDETLRNKKLILGFYPVDTEHGDPPDEINVFLAFDLGKIE